MASRLSERSTTLARKGHQIIIQYQYTWELLSFYSTLVGSTRPQFWNWPGVYVQSPNLKSHRLLSLVLAHFSNLMLGSNNRYSTVSSLMETNSRFMSYYLIINRWNNHRQLSWHPSALKFKKPLHWKSALTTYSAFPGGIHHNLIFSISVYRWTLTDNSTWHFVFLRLTTSLTSTTNFLFV